MHWLKHTLATLAVTVLSVLLQLWLEQIELIPWLMHVLA